MNANPMILIALRIACLAAEQASPGASFSLATGGTLAVRFVQARVLEAQLPCPSHVVPLTHLRPANIMTAHAH